MNFKKAVSVTLTILMATMSFSGCRSLPANTSSGGTDNGALVPEKGAHLKFRTTSSTDTTFGKAVAAAFTKKYGVKVDVEQGGLFDANKQAIEGPSGKGPDVFMCADDKSFDGIQKGLFYPLADSIVKDLNENIKSVAMKTVTYKGKTYGVPVAIETYVLFYNKKLVTKPVSTFEELAAQAKTFNNPSKNKFWFLFDASTASPIYPMLSTYGFNLYGKDGTDAKPGLDTPEFEKGLEVLQKYHEIVPINAADLGNTDFLDTHFENGDVGYIMSGPWDVKTFKDAKVDFGVVSLPTYDGHEEKSFEFVQNAQVSAYTKYPKASQLFADFLANKDNAKLLYTEANRITARKDLASIDGLKDDQVLIDIAKCIDKAVPMPKNDNISYFWSVCRDISPSVFDGNVTPQEGAKKAAQEYDDYCKSAA